jgi:hypothetical protein
MINNLAYFIFWESFFTIKVYYLFKDMTQWPKKIDKFYLKNLGKIAINFTLTLLKFVKKI